MTKLILSLALIAPYCFADIIYSNTTSDQQTSVFYSASGYTEIGDQIHMISSGMVGSVAAQFYNDGADATFDAVLSIYDVDSPVGSLLDGPFLESGIFIGSGDSQTVGFSNLGGLQLPQDVIVTFAVENVSSGGDIGVNLFDPPETGTSSNKFFIANDGTGFSQASTNLGIDNLYLQVDTIPEPASIWMTAGVLALLYRKAQRSY